MAHFTIQIQHGMCVDIYKGEIFKKNLNLFNFWRAAKNTNEKRTGYVAIVPSAGKTKTEYLLTKNSDGNWSIEGSDPGISIKIDGKWIAAKEDDTTLAIKKAVDTYEFAKTENE